MSLSAISSALLTPQQIALTSTPPADGAATPAVGSGGSPPASSAPDRPHDHDTDNRPAVATSAIALSSTDVQAALAALTHGGK